MPGSGLGILRDPDMQVLRRGGAMVTITPEIRAFLMQPAPLIITKSDVMATVHRRAPMDYVGIKQFDASGELTGELRVVGLFTSTAYTRSPREIPLIRRKIERVVGGERVQPAEPFGQGSINVLETFPRDELFQMDVPTLSTMAHGIMRLAERPRARLFVRRDQFDRFISAFVFLPRDRFNTDDRIKVGELIAEAYGGKVTSFEPAFRRGHAGARAFHHRPRPRNDAVARSRQARRCDPRRHPDLGRQAGGGSRNGPRHAGGPAHRGTVPRGVSGRLHRARTARRNRSRTLPRSTG